MLDWIEDFKLSDEELEAISEPEWIIPNLIISGHIVMITAEPNGGKTTIMFHLAGEMVRQGYNVNYVNADISGGDAKPLAKQSNELGFSLLLPDMKEGKNMDSVLYELIEISKSQDRFDDVVFIFDTLKKMLNVISKSAAKRFFDLFRALSAKGMTIVLLAHTNKYKDQEGNPIYEGTGDLRADIDELIYLIPQRHEDKSMTVTTKPDKVRGAFDPITFKISPERVVTQSDDVVNTKLANEIAEQLRQDQAVIDSINKAISADLVTQKDIIGYCSNDGYGQRTVKKILIKYTVITDQPEDSIANSRVISQLWKKSKGDKNSHIFSFI